MNKYSSYKNNYLEIITKVTDKYFIRVQLKITYIFQSDSKEKHNKIYQQVKIIKIFKATYFWNVL